MNKRNFPRIFLFSILLFGLIPVPCVFTSGSGRSSCRGLETSDPSISHLKVITRDPASPVNPGLQTMEIGEILIRLAQRLDEFPEMTHWKVHVSSMLTRVNKQWQPQKKTLVEKIVTVEDGVRYEEIVSAVEEEKGRKKDVTEKFRDEAEKEAQKAREKSAKGEDQDERTMELKQEDLFPFSEEHRGYYDFIRLPDELIDQRPVIVIESRSRRKSRDYFQGKYYIDSKSWNVVKVELQPAKLSGALKTLEMVLTFMEIPDGHLVPKTTWVRLHVGLVVKNIRIESEDIYSDYQVLR